jgi:hypothetical protein
LIIFIVMLLILAIVIYVFYTDEIIAYFNELIFKSSEEELACMSNRLYTDYISLNQAALDAYKTLINEAVNSRQRYDK